MPQFSWRGRYSASQDPLDTVTRGIQNYQTRLGYIGAPIPQPEEDKNWFFKLLDIIDRPRNAVVSGIENARYGGSFGEGLKEGFTGQTHTSVSDMLDEMGVENKIAKFGLGFLGDVALDPTTYATLGLGSFLKGSTTGMARNLTREASEKLAKDTLLDSLGEIITKTAKPYGIEGAIYSGVNKSEDALKAMQQLSGNRDALEEFLQRADVLNPQGMNTPVEALRNTLNPLLDTNAFTKSATQNLTKPATPEELARIVSDARNALVEKGMTQFIDTTAGHNALDAFKNAERLSGEGVGLKLPFTNIGPTFIKGDTMQQAGAKFGNVMKNVPVVGKIAEGTQDIGQKLFNKYYLPKTTETARQYLRAKDIERAGNIDLANEEHIGYVKNLSKGQLTKGHEKDLDTILALAGKNTDDAAKYINNMEDSPFKDFLLRYGEFEGQPIHNIDLNEYSKNVQKKVYTLLTKDEVASYLEKGLNGIIKGKGKDANTLRYFADNGDDAVRSAWNEANKAVDPSVPKGEIYMVEADNLASGATKEFDRLANALKQDPKYFEGTRIFDPTNTLKVYKINLDAKSADEAIQTLSKGDVTNNLKVDLEDLNINGGASKYFKPAESKINYANVRHMIKTKDGKTFVPKMTKDGTFDKSVYEVWENGVRQAELKPEDATALQQYGFKDINDFNATKSEGEFSLNGIEDTLKEADKGMNETGKWEAATSILENPEKLYGDSNAPMDKALRTYGLILMDRMRESGLKEKNVGVLSSLLEDYIPHVLNWENLKREGKTFQKGGMTRNMGNMNFSNLGREYKMTIEEVNQLMESKGYGANYFETNLAKAYISRMIRHNKVIFDNQFTERLLHGVGYEISNWPLKKISTMVKDMGGDIKDYTIVVPRAALKVFALNKPEANVLDAMVSFINKGDELSTGANQIGKVRGAMQGVEDSLRGFSSWLTKLTQSNPTAGNMIEGLMTGANRDDVMKALSTMTDLNPSDLKIITELSDIMKRMPTKAVSKFRDTWGLRSTLQNLLRIEDGPLAQVTTDDLQMLGVHLSEVKAFAIPKSVYSYVTKMGKAQTDEGIRTIEKGIDRFNGLWKTSVTALLPSFHLRNLFGGNQQNMFEFGMKALSPKLQGAAAKMALGKDGFISLNGRQYSYEELKKLMIKYRVETPFLRTEVKDLQDIYYRELEKNLKMVSSDQKGIRGAMRKPSEVGRKVGNAVEEDVRAVNFMAWLDKGMDAQNAAELTKRAHFDYTELSEAERRIFKRVMPFYTFFRKNFPYQVQHFLNKPGDVTMLSHGIENAANANDFDTENIPSWMRESFALPLKKGEDNRDYYANLSLPVADVQGRSPREILAGLNPLITTPFELLTNQALLNGAPISKYPGQTTDIGPMNVDNRVLQVLNKAGIMRNAIDGLRNTSTNDEARMLTPANAFSPKSMAGLVRGYDPERGLLNKLYDYERELGNKVQEMKDKGVDVPGVNDIQSPVSRRKRGSNIQPRPNTPTQESRGILSF